MPLMLIGTILSYYPKITEKVNYCFVDQHSHSYMFREPHIISYVIWQKSRMTHLMELRWVNHKEENICMENNCTLNSSLQNSNI